MEGCRGVGGRAPGKGLIEGIRFASYGVQGGFLVAIFPL